MDINLNPVSAANQQYTPPAIKTSVTTDAFSAPKAATPAVQQTVPATTDASGSTTNSSQQYEAALRQAALSFKNTYAVSDQQFSIFKDATGKYITRYVSERDGKVTYLPEPTLVKQLQLSGNTTPTRVAISA